jgi:hypothetical protein
MLKQFGWTAISVVLAGCAGDISIPPSSSTSRPLDSVRPAGGLTTPTPAASLQLPNGNTVEFYRIAGRVLVSEDGAAYTPPVLTPSLMKSRLPDLWTALAPGLPVPQALNDLQAMLDSPVPPPDFKPGTTQGPPGFSSGGMSADLAQPGTSDEGLRASPVGCNNGCCDYDWLSSTFFECSNSVAEPVNWFLFNYGWSYADDTGVSDVWTMVCAAEQSSQTININGYGGTWTVDEAHYKEFHYLNCLWPWCTGQTLTSSVNSSTNPHLHTYCGVLD